MSRLPNDCDDCGRRRATLYRKGARLICYHCLPVDDLSGARARRTIKAAVTGALNIDRLRARLSAPK